MFPSAPFKKNIKAEISPQAQTNRETTAVFVPRETPDQTLL